MRQGLGLTASYAIRSAVLTVLMAVLLAGAVGWQVDRAVVDEWGRAASTVAGAMLAEGLIDASLSGPLAGDDFSAFDARVQDRLLPSGFTAVKVWNTEAVLVYSSDGEDVGRSFAGRPAIEDALGGSVISKVVRTPDEENIGQVQRAGRVMEAYAPLTAPDGTVIGVFEIYSSYESVAEHVRMANTAIAAVVAFGALLLYFAQLQVVHRAEARLREKEAEATLVNGRLERSLADLEEQSVGTLQALITAVDAKDTYTARHSLAVTEYAIATARRLGIKGHELALVEQASLLHDVGKIGIPEEILLKPSALDDLEFAKVREHSEMGAHIVESIPFLRDLVPVVRHHHEHWNGGGYPAGLERDDIPLLSRILAVADAFDAMTSDRPYRSGMRVSAARTELIRCRGRQFDPACVDALVTAIDLGEVSVSRYHLERQALKSVAAGT